MTFNGAAPRTATEPRPAATPAQDNGWIAIYINPPLFRFFEELKTHPNIPYTPWGARLAEDHSGGIQVRNVRWSVAAGIVRRSRRARMVDNGADGSEFRYATRPAQREGMIA